MTDIPFRVEPDTSPGVAPLALEPPRRGRVRVTVRLGERPTGGYSIAVTGVTRSDTRLTIACETRAPRAGALVIQVLTSPAQTVSIDEGLARGIRTAVLVDETAAELARINA